MVKAEIEGQRSMVNGQREEIEITEDIIEETTEDETIEEVTEESEEMTDN